MNFKQLYRKFYTVRLSLFFITFIMTVALLVLSINFWLEVESTRKYSKLAINNSILQEKINKLYNLLSLEKINIQYFLSISSKSINIPSKDRKEIKKNNDIALSAYKELLSELENYSQENIDNNELKNLILVWKQYQEVKGQISAILGRVITLRGTTTAARGNSNKDNPAEKLLSMWLEKSDLICMQLIIMSEKLNFRPNRLIRSIEDLQSFKNLLLRYNEYIYREQAILAGVISIDTPISIKEYKVLSSYQNIEKETKLTLEKKLARSIEIANKRKNEESAFYKNFKKISYFDNNFNNIKNKLIEEGVAWEKYSLDIKKYLDIIKENKTNNEQLIILLSNTISQLSTNLYQKSLNNQIIASITLIVTLLLATFSFMIVTYTIARPLENITSVMQKLSKGEKTSKVPEINRSGEIGIMASAVASFKEKADNYAKQLEITVNERTKKLKEVNDLLTSSINYASKIQNAFLPQKILIKEYCNDFFIYHDQRDIVGGDFYTIFEQDNKIYVAVFDCAGHGVPGALLTMILGSFLKNITKDKLNSPSELLTKMNVFFKEALSNTEGYEVSEDGLDALVLEITKQNNSFRYASAGMPLILINNKENKVLKGDKKGIGYSSTPLNYKFSNFALNVNKNDLLYLASDGICDQIGGKGISFGNKRLIETLEKVKNLSMEGQKNKFIENFETYRSDFKRRDDITLIGIRV